MKTNIFSFFCALMIVSTALFAQKQFTPEQFMTGSSSGNEYYFTIPPAYLVNNSVDRIALYITSLSDGNATVEVASKGYKVNVTLKAYKTSEIIMPIPAAQVFTKADNVPAPVEKVYEQAGIHITSDVQVVVYASVRVQFTSDTFTPLPVESLGTEYVVSSMEDMSVMYPGFNFPSMTFITAAYDNTELTITLGGTTKNSTTGGRLGTTIWTVYLNKGDVYAISSLSAGMDVTGTRIKSTLPVNVVSGNQCANVPAGMRWCDYIAECELPTYSHGKTYILPMNEGRKIHFYMKAQASGSSDVNLKRNGVPFTLLRGNATTSDGYFVGDANSSNTATVIEGDNPFTITLFNKGQEVDNVASDPFQMVAIPIEQYSNSYIFNTPGINGGLGFTINNMSIITPLDANDKIPSDMMFGIYTGGTMNWQTLASVYGDTVSSIVTVNGVRWGIKMCKLPGDNIYAMTSSLPFGLYSFGASNYDSYGHPAVVLTRQIGISDTEPPTVTVSTNPSKGTFASGGVSDIIAGKDEPLGKIALLPTSSNVVLKYNPEYAIRKSSTEWSLRPKDPSKSATADIVFCDKAGNRVVKTFKYEAGTLSVDDDAIRLMPLAYPNPTNKSSVIEFTGFGLSELRLHNLMGEQVFNSSFIANGNTKQIIDLDNLSVGIYVLHISSGGYHTTLKIVRE
jgi:hypothetical protein